MDTLLGFPIPCDCLDWTFTKANAYLKKQRNKLAQLKRDWLLISLE